MWKIHFLRLALEEFSALPVTAQQGFVAIFDRVKALGPFDLGHGKLRQIRGGIWEFRLSGRVEYRALFSFERGKVVLLLVFFIKKSQKTPEREIEKAEFRLRQFRQWKLTKGGDSQ